MKKIAVIGSVNMDLVFETNKIPEKGETIQGQNFSMNIGGKGANQAVAAARLGGDVTFFGAVGEDLFGEKIRGYFNQENVKTVLDSSAVSTGVAQVNIFDSDNSIIVIPGANWDISEEFILNVEKAIPEFDIFVFQLEIKASVVERIVRKIREYPDKIIILDPAPAQKLPTAVIDLVDYLTPNEHEIKQIGLNADNIENLLKKYPRKLLVTQGEKGVQYFDESKNFDVVVPALKNISVFDTTGAGDTFSGAFSYALSVGKSLEKAIQFGNVAAGISVGKLGAQTGMPRLTEVEVVIAKEVRA